MRVARVRASVVVSGSVGHGVALTGGSRGRGGCPTGRTVSGRAASGAGDPRSARARRRVRIRHACHEASDDRRPGQHAPLWTLVWTALAHVRPLRHGRARSERVRRRNGSEPGVSGRSVAECARIRHDRVGPGSRSLDAIGSGSRRARISLPILQPGRGQIRSTLGEGGGATGARTPDLLHAMQMLSQLSYRPRPRILPSDHSSTDRLGPTATRRMRRPEAIGQIRVVRGLPARGWGCMVRVTDQGYEVTVGPTGHPALVPLATTSDSYRCRVCVARSPSCSQACSSQRL